MFGNVLMQNSRFRYIIHGLQRDRTVVPQRDAIEYKSPVSVLKVVSHSFTQPFVTVWSAATNSHPEFFGRAGTAE